MSTIREIAIRAGVSTATVSRYFTGSGIVSNESARKIEKVSAELNYQYETKKPRKTGIIAVLITHLRIAFFQDVLRELMEQLPRFKYQMVFIPLIEGSEDYKMFFKELNIEGVIYLDEDIHDEVLSYISSKKIKLVMCGGAAFDRRSDMIHINDMAAAYEGMKYLLELGHEKILILSGHLKNISCGYQRLMGCKRALEEKDISFEDNDLISYGNITYEMGYKLTNDKIKAGIEFTAIFAFTDEMALGAIAALYDNDLIVPENISVLGFDDISISNKIVPQLTTIHQPIELFVTKTLNAFLDLDNNNTNLEITLPYEILKRGTCRARERWRNE